MQLFDSYGNRIVLGRELGRGGEGAVFELAGNPSSVAKIYKQFEHDRPKKLAAMLRCANADLERIVAWPTTTLHRTVGGDFVGFVMPRVSGFREIHQLYSPAQRKHFFPKADWSFLVHVAMNCAAAFETVHASGHVIGDVNQSGVMTSEHGVVRLIDCDSFQIRDGNSVYRCLVGVPQYTPPEIQGASFRNVERTQEHDTFGLALLIFHLLFMGRHPFAGRFLGSGDMPIERAISEERFAFGPHAASRQMTPPPHSLPLSSLPNAIAVMFERAFSRSRGGLFRPSAPEWRMAMTALKNSLQVCPTEEGHKFPSSAGSCPWCAIMHSAGPNFFISVFLGGTGTYKFAVFDADEFIRRIESVLSPSAQKQPLTPQAVTPRPLPPEVNDQQFLIKCLRIVTIGAAICALVGLLLHPVVIYMGGGLAAVFGGWWTFMAFNSRFRQEIRARMKEVKRLEELRASEERAWDHCLWEAGSTFTVKKRELLNVVTQGRNLSSQFAAERRALEAKRREEQLNEFLDRKYLTDYKIDKVGPGRMATLCSYDVETAADVTVEKLAAIPGFGPRIIENLMQWRRRMESQFRFDASRPVPPVKINALVMRFQDLQRRCESHLSNGIRDLENHRELAESELAARSARLITVSRHLVQARADADVKRVA